ncbi:unnamed protein product [Durusdinium trenchii]|uniref:Uncharacterized protein n=1 Tax=Durusdinium trenchii TaxID=1381693 RepID=A0ABP0HC50_9DINO
MSRAVECDQCPLRLSRRAALTLHKLAVPLVVLHLVDFICQTSNPAQNQRDLMVFEVFSGVSRIYSTAREERLKPDYYDVLWRPRVNDLLGMSGLIYAVRQTLRLVPSGLVFLGVPCSMLVWISSGTHGRAAPNFMGDSSIPGVVASNTLLARASLLCCLAMARSVFWAVEQPGSSCLPKTPYWRRLLVLKIKRMHFIRFYMGAYKHMSWKLTMVFGSWPRIPMLYRKFTRCGGKDLKRTGEYTKPFARKVVKEFCNLTAGEKEEASNVDFERMNPLNAPVQWKHLDLKQIEEFLQQRIDDGSFHPQFAWKPEHLA